MKTFSWIPEPEPRQKEYLKEVISEYLDISHSDIKPCCIGAMFIEVIITGPLKNMYQCLVKCSCGKKLLGFTYDGSESEVVKSERPTEDKTDV